MATYLVTGCAGFIGSSITEALLQRGESVRGLDNFETGKRENLAAFHGKMEFIECDLRDADAMASACRGVDYAFHIAALPSVPRSVEDPRTSHTANVEGTFNLLEGARAAGVKRVVYSASSSAYGDQPGFPRRETMAPAPISPYAVQKLVGEYYMSSYWQVYGLETVSLHLDKSFEAMRLRTRAGKVAPRTVNGHSVLIDERYFEIERWAVDPAKTPPGLTANSGGLQVLFVAEGKISITADGGESFSVNRCELAVIPATSRNVRVVADVGAGSATVIRIQPRAV